MTGHQPSRQDMGASFGPGARAAFTPGPWKVQSEEADKLYIRVRGTQLGKRFKIANVLSSVNHESEKQEAAANAKLIAKSPELYEALEVIRGMLAGSAGQPNLMGDIYKIADAALAEKFA